MNARLFCKTGELAGKTYEITDDNIIGRRSDADVILPSKLISGRHARIYASQGAFFVEDLGSSNGTWVDGVRVSEPVRLDRLHIVTFAGTFDFVFEIQEGPSVEASPETPLEAPAPEAKRPQVEAAVAAADDDHRTQLDLDDFTPLPELEGSGTDSSADQPDLRTHADLQDFPPLPELERSGTAGTESRAPRDTEPFEQLQEPREPPAERYGLEVSFPDGRRESFDLVEGDQTVGRSPKCDIVLRDPSVSRRHATLTVGETVILRDAGSRHGIHLEGREIREAEIRPGSVFTFGPEIELKLIRR